MLCVKSTVAWNIGNVEEFDISPTQLLSSFPNSGFASGYTVAQVAPSGNIVDWDLHEKRLAE